MTEAQATTESARINGIQGTEVIISKVFALWLPNYTKDYNVTTIPNKYNANFEAATESQKLAFARVSLTAQKGNVSTATFVTNYDAEAAKDTELAAYLGL